MFCPNITLGYWHYLCDLVDIREVLTEAPLLWFVVANWNFSFRGSVWQIKLVGEAMLQALVIDLVLEFVKRESISIMSFLRQNGGPERRRVRYGPLWRHQYKLK